jgi:hypothetical protein
LSAVGKSLDEDLDEFETSSESEVEVEVFVVLEDDFFFVFEFFGGTVDFFVVVWGKSSEDEVEDLEVSHEISHSSEEECEIGSEAGRPK